MKRTIQRLVKMLVGLAMGVLMSEVTLRVLPRSLLPQEFGILDRVYTARGSWQDMMTGDPYLGYKLKPNVDILFPSEGRSIPYKTTNYGMGDIGFRDIGAKPPFSVIAVGDSFALCDDVPAEACWVRHLAQQTDLSIGTLGVNGYSTLAEARVLERYGVQFKPKVVLVGIYLNDFKDNVNFDNWSRSGHENFWVWLGAQRGRGQFGRWLADHSVIYRMIDGASRARGRDIHKFKNENLDFVFRMDRWWFQLLRNTENDKGFKLMQKALLDMKARTAGIGGELVVLLFPAREQVYWDFAKQFAPADGRSLDPDHPLDVVRDFSKANGIKFCELADPLRVEAARGRQLYHRISSHFNDEGNVVAAGVIAKCLDDQGLVTFARGSSHQPE